MSVSIGNKVESIGNSAFESNELTSVDIGESVASIGKYTFYGNQLVNVVIPDSVTSIGYKAFHGNPLETVSISVNAPFDLSVFPEDIEIMVRGGLAPISLDDITAQGEVSTFDLSEPIIINNQDIETVIVGTKKKDKITGTSEGEVLAGQEGKDILNGRGGPDGFLFQDPQGFGIKKADIVRDFDSNEGDSILLDNSLFGLGKQIKLKSYGSKNKVKKAAKSKNDFVYDDKKGLLYFNENGKQKGWGDGGLFAKLQGAPELGADDFTIV